MEREMGNQKRNSVQCPLYFYEMALTCLSHSFRMLPRALQVNNHKYQLQSSSCGSKRTPNCCHNCKLPGKANHIPGSLLSHKSHSFPMETALPSHGYPRANELQARYLSKLPQIAQGCFCPSGSSIKSLSIYKTFRK